MELVRQKNAATVIVFPIIDADGDTVTGAASLDSEIDTWTDGAAPDGFADCTNEATEIGTTGIYSLSLTATEMNNDYIYIQVKTSTSGAKTQHILINTIVGDPLNRATTDDGGTINVASGIVEAQVKSMDAGTITAAVVATGAIDADAIADNAIDAGAIAADAITAAKIANGAIDAATFAAGAIDAAAIATGAIDADAIADNAIDAGAIAADAITAAKIADGAIDRATFAAETGLQSVRSNTAQAGGATSITLDASASATTDFYKHCLIYLTGATGVGQYRICTAYNGTTKVATITPAWATNPDATSTFAVMAFGIANIEAIAGSAVSTTTAQLGVNVVQAGGTAWGSGAITAGSIATDAITAAKIADGAIDAATFAAGAIDATAIADNAIDAGAIASNAITAAKIASAAFTAAKFAADAIDANALAADAVTEIWNKACTEPTSVVGASPAAIAALSWLLTLSRNKITQSATTQTLLADDGSTTIAASTVSDSGTVFTRGEFA